MAPSSVGPMFRSWRTHRNLSQLALSTEAGVSQRHLSHLETGKSRPSPEMVLHLAEVLDVPLRDRNALLVAAGHAPRYSHLSLDDPRMGDVNRAIDLMLDAHEPYPAIVVDHRWDLVRSNDAAGRLTPRLVDPSSPAVTDPLNVMRLTFHPDGLRHAVANWDDLAPALAHRVRRDAAARPHDRELQEVASEVLAYAAEVDGAPDGAPDLVVPIHYRVPGLELRLFSTLASIGSPLDVTLDELSIELFFPADERSAAVLRDLRVHGSGSD